MLGRSPPLLAAIGSHALINNNLWANYKPAVLSVAAAAAADASVAAVVAPEAEERVSFNLARKAASCPE